MEESGGGVRDNVVKVSVRKRRSQPFRRPRPDETNDQSSSSLARASDDASKGSSDETNGGDTNSRRKDFNLNHCEVHVSSSSRTEPNGVYSIFYNNEPTRSGSSNKRSNECVLAPANWKNDTNSEWENGEISRGAAALDEFGRESMVKKVKLNVGGVTRTISTSNGASESGSSKNSQASDFSRRGKQNAQGNSEFASSLDKKSGLKGIPWKDFSKGGFNFGKRDPTAAGKTIGKRTATDKKEGKSESVRKSKRVPKRRSMDEEFDEDDDDEIRFVKKLKAPNGILVNKNSGEEPGKKQRKLVSVSDLECTVETKANRDGKKKLRTEDTDYVEEEEVGSDGGVEGSKKNKKQKKESIDNLMENSKKETMTLTTRQRALHSSKDTSSLIEFPNGLPPVPSKKQKEKLTEVEQQFKKAEAAQRRKLQNEKAARESEAEAIRKILGQDSNRKKKEDKIKKRQEALAEEKAATALLLSGSTVRLVMGPTGTTVTFPNEMGLPRMFDPKPCSYPPPRENCAGPSCLNPYKYRDSKTNLPLCSLQCYKAVQQKTVPERSSISVC